MTDNETTTPASEPVGAPAEQPVRRACLNEMLDALRAMADGHCPCQELPEDCKQPCAARVAIDAYAEAAEIIGRGISDAIRAQKPNEFNHILTPRVLWDLYAR